jgi:hypothetical protein
MLWPILISVSEAPGSYFFWANADRCRASAVAATPQASQGLINMMPPLTRSGDRHRLDTCEFSRSRQPLRVAILPSLALAGACPMMRPRSSFGKVIPPSVVPSWHLVAGFPLCGQFGKRKSPPLISPNVRSRTANRRSRTPATGRSATFVRLESTSLPSALPAHRGRGYPWGYSLNLGDRRRGIQRHAEPRVIDPSSTRKKLSTAISR